MQCVMLKNKKNIRIWNLKNPNKTKYANSAAEVDVVYNVSIVIKGQELKYT